MNAQIRRVLLGLLFVAVMALPLGIQAQDMRGGSLEDIASSVVSIEALRNNRAIASGTGTIINPEGEIYTNYHVIEGANNFAIYMLNDIGDLPELRYYASMIYQDANLDFAVLQIDRDRNGNRIDPTREALPFYPPAPEQEVSLGDAVRIFGYPGIGEGYMIVTTGEIVNVQNGTINGQRVPVWYRTDAEISGGNSGGMAIDGNGNFIGVPTWVISDGETAGRLGGLLPITAIQQAIVAGAQNPAPNNNNPSVSGTGSLTVENRTDAIICQLYVSPTSASTWGNNMLSAGERIQPNAKYKLSPEAGYYDILMVGCQNEELGDFRNILVERDTLFIFDGDDSTYVAGENLTTLTLENRSNRSICYVYISPVTSDSWGLDQLGAQEIISAGTSRVWELDQAAYDILLRDCQQNTLKEFRDIAVSGATTITYP